MLLAVDFFRAVHNDFLNQLINRDRIKFLQVRILLCKIEKAADICNLFRSMARLTLCVTHISSRIVLPCIVPGFHA